MCEKRGLSFSLPNIQPDGVDLFWRMFIKSPVWDFASGFGREGPRGRINIWRRRVNSSDASRPTPTRIARLRSSHATHTTMQLARYFPSTTGRVATIGRDQQNRRAPLPSASRPPPPTPAPFLELARESDGRK